MGIRPPWTPTTPVIETPSVRHPDQEDHHMNVTTATPVCYVSTCTNPATDVMPEIAEPVCADCLAAYLDVLVWWDQDRIVP